VHLKHHQPGTRHEHGDTRTFDASASEYRSAAGKLVDACARPRCSRQVRSAAFSVGNPIDTLPKRVTRSIFLRSERPTQVRVFRASGGRRRE
jgi:hypothetical protein